MPIYEFECRHCGHRFDRLQRLSDEDPVICPSCNEPQLQRRVSAPSFRLAGSGWYETDFKKEGDKKRNLAGDSAARESAEAPVKAVPATTATPAAAPSPAPAAPAAPAKAAGKE